MIGLGEVNFALQCTYHRSVVGQLTLVINGNRLAHGSVRFEWFSNSSPHSFPGFVRYSGTEKNPGNSLNQGDKIAILAMYCIALSMPKFAVLLNNSGALINIRAVVNQAGTDLQTNALALTLPIAWQP